jgi:2-methylcitrate dehydratase PrpD
MIRRVDYRTFSADEARDGHHTIVTSRVEIVLKSGLVLAERADFGKGNKADPLSWDDIATKFRECALYRRWPEAATERAIERIGRLEQMEDIRTLTADFAVAPGGLQQERRRPHDNDR